MDITPQLFTATVMHKRLSPKVNQFTYGVYYIGLPLSKLHHPEVTNHLPLNRWGLHSFYEKDHGKRDGDISAWLTPILSSYGLTEYADHVMLVTMPRVMGYVFNPVSFYLIMDTQHLLRAVLCEVNNTFGETHSYLCMHENKRAIAADDWLEGEKLFHVSPFLERKGHYTFRFALGKHTLGVWIDFYDENARKTLLTSLTGRFTPLTKASLRKAYLTHPLVTLKAIMLIHWQAMKLLCKGIKYIPKPIQRKRRLSTMRNIKKM